MLTVYSRGVLINSKKIEFKECLAAWHNLAFFKNYRIYGRAHKRSRLQLEDYFNISTRFHTIKCWLKLGEICSENKRQNFQRMLLQPVSWLNKKFFLLFFLFNRSSTEDSESRGLSSFTALRLHIAMVSRRLIMGSGLPLSI